MTILVSIIIIHIRGGELWQSLLAIAGKPWTDADVRELKQFVKGNTPTRVIGVKLGRTEGAIYRKASELDISLKPTNQSPYNRQPKAKK